MDGTVSASLPAFYYFKQRKREVIDFVMDSVRDKESILMRGDTDEFFKRKMPEAKTSREKLKVFGEIERMFKKTTQTLATNPSEVFDRDLRHMARKSNLERAKSNKVFRNLAKNDQDYCFEMNLASKIRQQKYDVEAFLLKNNFFNRPHEDIQTIFKVMMTTFDYPSSVQRPSATPPPHLPRETPLHGVNLDRLGLLDTEVLFREVERAERSK